MQMTIYIHSLSSAVGSNKTEQDKVGESLEHYEIKETNAENENTSTIYSCTFVKSLSCIKNVYWLKIFTIIAQSVTFRSISIIRYFF